MRTLAIISMSLLFTAFFTPELKAQEPKGDKVVTIEANMTCDGCKKTIEAGLAKEKGVKSVAADSKTKKVVVTYDGSQNSDDNLVSSIEKMGYKAKVSGEKAKKSDDSSNKAGGGC